jgi:acetyltransferase-like isoleucine patch superfamily enzyme
MIDLMKIIIKLVYFSIKKIELKRKNVYIEKNVSFLRTNFSIFNRINKNTNVDRSSFGAYTYVAKNCFLADVRIGAFCSIGPYVEVIYGTHPMNFVSTNPVFFSNRKQCGTSFINENVISDFSLISNLSAIIENDVWIGFGAKIIEGVTIGNGAIVLAGAYVTKDVEPYSIVGGVPAKHIRYRFDEEQRKLLLEFKWWNKDINWIKNNAHIFSSIDLFLEISKQS